MCPSFTTPIQIFFFSTLFIICKCNSFSYFILSIIFCIILQLHFVLINTAVFLEKREIYEKKAEKNRWKKCHHMLFFHFNERIFFFLSFVLHYIDSFMLDFMQFFEYNGKLRLSIFA